MGDIYIGDFGKKGDFFSLSTNCEDHKATINFDGCRFLDVEDGILCALHATSIEGLNKKSTITFPSTVLLHVHTKSYEYEGFSDGKKTKATVEPTNREKLLYKLLTDKELGIDHEANTGKGGFLSLGASANDVPVLNGEGNIKKHARFVLEFDDDIKPFDMTGDAFKLDGLSTKGGKSGFSSKPAETEAQKIETRQKALVALMESYNMTVKEASESQQFVVHASLMLGLPVPSSTAFTF